MKKILHENGNTYEVEILTAEKTEAGKNYINIDGKQFELVSKVKINAETITDEMSERVKPNNKTQLPKNKDFRVIVTGEQMVKDKDNLQVGDWLNCESINGFDFQNGKVHILKDFDDNIFIRRAEIKNGLIYLNCDNPEYADSNLVYSPETIKEDFKEIAVAHTYGRTV